MKNFLVISLVLFVYTTLSSQQVIYLDNPSFEDEPRIGTAMNGGPRGWTDCGFKNESPVDIHPSPLANNPYFGVTQMNR